MESKSEITVSFIGAGHVAYHLALSFYKVGVKINQVYNRSPLNGNNLSDKVGAKYITAIKELEPSDYLIIAVNDSAIHSVSRAIPKSLSKSTIIVHTSGSVPIDILREHGCYGGFYPLQSFRRELEIDITKVPILISSTDEKVIAKLLHLGKTISKTVIALSDMDRSLLHLPAVMVNNFTNHLLQLAFDYCEKTNLDFTLLHPLINETVKRLENQKPPREMQTGPAIRNDRLTINRHINQLQEYPEILHLYKLMTQHIEDYYK